MLGAKWLDADSRKVQRSLSRPSRLGSAERCLAGAH